MEKPEISVITAVYNIGKYLGQCLDSMLAQTFHEWELIVIDDGSTDDSPAICDEYAARDSRIRVVHKANTGLSDSRNLGIGMAKADIIGFIDSDDWIEPDMFGTLYHTLIDSGADIAVCGIYKAYRNSSKVKLPCHGIVTYTRDEALDIILEDRKINSYVWNKLYRKEVLKEKMPSRMYEDHATVYKWFINADKIVAIGKPLYHYRQREGSIDHHVNPQRSIDFLTSEIERYQYIVAQNLLPQRQEFFRNRLLRIGVKMAKEVSRSGVESEKIERYVLKIRDMLIPFLTVDKKLMGRKHRCRLEKLISDPYKFIRSMKFSAIFNFKIKRAYFSK